MCANYPTAVFFSIIILKNRISLKVSKRLSGKLERLNLKINSLFI